MKVSELSGAMLDLWVAKAAGCRIVAEPASGEEKSGTAWLTAAPWIGDEEEEQPKKVIRWGLGMFGVFSPSTNWGDGGPIIESEGIEWEQQSSTDGMTSGWLASVEPRAGKPNPPWQWGEAQLIAAMRAYVASKFGDEVSEE